MASWGDAVPEVIRQPLGRLVKQMPQMRLAAHAVLPRLIFKAWIISIIF